MIRVERRLQQPRWLSVAVPAGSLLVALAIGAVVLVVTGHDPSETYRRLLDRGFVGQASFSATLTAMTPLLFAGLAAAAAFRMRLWNIGGEGQLYLGAIGAAAAGIWLGQRNAALLVVAMVVAGAAFGAAWALIPGVLRAFAATNEIIVSLMLNYVAGLLLTYLIFDSSSYWRDTSTPEARVFPQGKPLPDAGSWATVDVGDVRVPLGLLLGLAVAAGLWGLYRFTRFGFELAVIGDSTRAARYAGMRTRRKIVAVMALSGGIAGMAGASQIGDFQHVLDPRGLQAAGFGYAGIVVAALARTNPFAVVLVAFVLGGITNAGFSLQGADFPNGLVGVLEGLILFATLGGELLLRYRVRLARTPAAAAEAVS